jgi:biotin carboxyl carrier protein
VVEVIDIKQLDAARFRFTELGDAISDMAQANTESMDSLMASLKEGFKSVIEEVSRDPRLVGGTRVSGVSEQYVSSVAGKVSSMSPGVIHSFESLERTLTGVERSFGILADDARAKVSGAGGETDHDGEGADTEGTTKDPKQKGTDKKKKGIAGIMQAEGRNLKGRVQGMLARLKIPNKVGAVLAGGLGILAYGYMDRNRVRAQAGEVKNILIAAYDDGVKGSLAAGTASLSRMQEAFQKYKGIQREEFQNTEQALVDGGFSVDQMLRKVDGDLRDTQASAVTVTLALDKMFELPGGESAKRMVTMMALYGKNSNDARESLVRMYMVGRDSGIGAMQFVKNVEDASSELSVMGFNIDNVVDIYATVTESFEKMGVPKQFAGRQAALGMQQISSGLAKMSDNWMVVLGERMGHGRGLEARQGMMDAFARVLQTRDVNELQKIISTVWDMALKASGGNEEAARYYVEKQVGWGYEGARVVQNIGRMAKEGRMVESAKATADSFAILKESFETEKEKASQFELMMNTWLKGLAFMGQAILGMVVQFIAWLIAYFKALPQFFQNLKNLDFEANTRLAADLNHTFWNMGAHEDQLKSAASQMANAAGAMFTDALGSSMRSLDTAWNFDPTGMRAKSAASAPGGAGGAPGGAGGAPRIITIPMPVAGAGGSQSVPATPPPASVVGGVPTNQWAGGGVTLSVEGPDPLGNLTVMLGGNCPRCGYSFAEGGGEVPETEAPGAEPWGFYESGGAAGATAGSATAAAASVGSSAGVGAGTVGGGASGPIDIVEKGSLGGRFRRQSLRPGAKEGQAHTGVDIYAKEGTPINSPAEGVVTHVGEGMGIGKNVTIRHPGQGDVTSWFGHMEDILVKEGDPIKAGQQIGTVGTSTGKGKKPTSPHLHYEVLRPERKQERPPSNLAHFEERMNPEDFVSNLGPGVSLYPGYSRGRG